MPPNNTPNQPQSPATPEPAPATPQTQINPSAAPLGPPPRSMPKTAKPAVKKKSDNTAQKSLLISEIRDGMVVMKDGSMRAVVMCQSINFDLMSPQEREGIEYSYQGFLNSLYFPVQILIRSQHINLDGYMERLEAIRRDQDNILLGLLMEDYITYVRYLVEAANIMDKQFYIVVPYYPNMLNKEGIASGAQKFSELFKPKQEGVITINETDFTKAKQELTQQVRVVANGLNQLGVKSIPLNTQELIELYYNVYNPVTAKQQPLTDVGDLDASIIGKGDGQAKQVFPGGGA
ncbi:MAG: hypothetical protein WD467_02045 [Candidatus Saccharimonadales bacterium]